ncbi:MAG: NAD-dependent epimerase/dehydratase family protein [Planctomycetales bacterium]|nr:NAD-dependent epimerase/dehydratase family protein [Planctomycetales bacterium]
MSGRLALVTGATGFVGSHLAEALAAAGWRVRALARPTSDLRWVRAIPGAEVAAGDVTAPASLDAAVAGAGTVFHCAGLTAARRSRDYDRVNAGGTRNLLEACARRRDPPRFVLVSSQAAAGPSAVGVPVTEDVPCRPLSPYGESKKRAEGIVRESAGPVPFTIVRPPAVYGPRDRATLEFFKLVSRGILPDRGRRDALLSLVHVRDLVAGILRAGEEPRAVGGTYFLAHPEPALWSGIFEAVAEAMGRPKLRRVPFTKPVLWLVALGQEIAAAATGRVPPLSRKRLPEFLHTSWVCSSERAAKDLGWRAKVPHREGLAESAAWYKREGWL